MTLDDYLQNRLLDLNASYLRRCGVILWCVWAMLVKRGTFTVAGMSEPVELGLATGTLRMALASLVILITSLATLVAALLGSAALVFALLVSPLWLPLLFLMAYLRARRNAKAHKRALDEARAGLQAKT